MIKIKNTNKTNFLQRRLWSCESLLPAHRNITIYWAILRLPEEQPCSLPPDSELKCMQNKSEGLCPDDVNVFFRLTRSSFSNNDKEGMMGGREKVVGGGGGGEGGGGSR